MESVTAGPGTLTLLSRLSKLVYRRTPEDKLGMKLRQFFLLSYLAEQDGVQQQVLGEILCMDSNNLVLLLNELEELGFAQRRRDPDDRRRHIVELTDKGRKTFRRAEQARETVEDEVLAALDREERDTLRRLLAKALAGA
jgi:MarR family transcriptional regulator, temperature-dependent positive regulator of motility